MLSGVSIFFYTIVSIYIYICDVVVRILLLTQRFKVQLFLQLFFSTNKMDEKIYRTFKYFFKVSYPQEVTSPRKKRLSANPKQVPHVIKKVSD